MLLGLCNRELFAVTVQMQKVKRNVENSEIVVTIFLLFELEYRFAENYGVIFSWGNGLYNLCLGYFIVTRFSLQICFESRYYINYFKMLQMKQAAWAMRVQRVRFFFIWLLLLLVNCVYSHYQLVGTPEAAFNRKPSSLTLPFLLSEWPPALS